MSFIEINLPKCTVYLTPDEISQLLQTDTSLFATGLKRGKGIARYKAQKEREGAKWGESEGNEIDEHLN